MNTLLNSLPDNLKEKLHEQSFPDWLDPMLAKLTHDHFADEQWIFERKLDGERVLAYRNGRDRRLMSRNQKTLNDTYPELADALPGLSDKPFVVDGEVVAFDGNVTSFQRLQNRMQIRDRDEARNSNVAVYYYLFDILHYDGRDLTDLPQRRRKKLLKQALDFDDPIRYTPHRNATSLDYYRQACTKGWEGLIAKDGEASYVHGRSSKWLKFKCVHQQEFVIGGYTDPEGERVGFGALLVGYYDEGDLKYAGKVGTGYSDDMLNRLHKKMSQLQVDDPPFDRGKLPSKGVHWIKPNLVGEVGYTELTGDNRLRHPRFLGLRDDKDPGDVVLEEKQT